MSAMDAEECAVACAEDARLQEAAAIVLAAGAGTRMKSDLPKVCHTVLGKPLVRWVVDAARAAGVGRVVAVVGYGRDLVIPLVESDCEIAVQEQQRGTADAVSSAKSALAGFAGPVVVLCGDCPLITAGTIANLVDVQQREGAAVVVLTMELADPTGYGRIIRDEDGQVACIVEQKDTTEEQKAVRECNSGFYCFDAEVLFDALNSVDSNNAQGEFYLTDVLGIARQAGRKVCAVRADDVDECLGVNTPAQLAEAEHIMAARG